MIIITIFKKMNNHLGLRLYDTMELYLRKVYMCNAKIANIYNVLLSDGNVDWKLGNQFIDGFSTNFFIEINENRLSIACSVDTGGEIESIMIDEYGNLNDSSLIFHDDVGKLKKYLQDLS